MTPATNHSLVPDATQNNEHHANPSHKLFEKTLVMLALITLTFNIAGWMKKREFKRFGETAMFITVGLSTSLLFRVVYSLIGADPILNDVQMSTSFFSLVLLPPIIFEGGYGVHRMLFFQNIPTILSLAFFGGIYSTVSIAIIMYIVTSLTSINLSVLESLILGALVSSTDPVSILSMLPKETDKTLYIIIFGESALNDAVSIILYRFFTGLAATESAKLTFGMFLLSVLQSFFVFWGSLIVGMGLAFAFAKLTKHQNLTHEAEKVEVIMLMVFAYSSYLLADVLGLTGIISVFFCGIGMAHYGKPNMSSMSVVVAKHMLHILSSMADCFIFMYLGMGLLAFPMAIYSPIVIGAAVIAIALGRTHVFLIGGAQNVAALTNPKASPIPWNHQVFLWFAGLRGAVAFALAVELLDNTNLQKQTRSLMFGTATMVIVITVYGINVMTPFMIRKLRIANPVSPDDSHQMVAHADSNADEDDEDDENFVSLSEIPPGFLGWLYRIDQKYLRPYFTNLSPVDAERHRVPTHGHEIPENKFKHGINLSDLTDDETDLVNLQSPPTHLVNSATATPTKHVNNITEMVVLQSAKVSAAHSPDGVQPETTIRSPPDVKK